MNAKDNVGSYSLSLQPFVDFTRTRLDQLTSGIVIYALPGSGKTTIARSILGKGLPVIDSDDAFFQWRKKVENNEQAEEMAGWSLFASTFVGGVKVVVTNLHNTFLRYASRAGFTIIGVWLEKEEYLRRVKTRKDLDVNLCSKWYDDVKSWRYSSYDKINVWVKDASEIAYYVYAKNSSAHGRSTYIDSSIDEGENQSKFGEVLRTSAMSYANRFDKVYTALGAGSREVQSLSEKLVCSKIYGNWTPPDIKVKIEANPILSSGSPEQKSRVNIIARVLACVGSAIKRVYVIGSLPIPKGIEEYQNIEIIQFTGLKDIKRDKPFSLFIWEGTDKYDLPLNHASSVSYEKRLYEQLIIVGQCIRIRSCNRVVFNAVVRPIFQHLGVKDCSLQFLPLPDIDYSSLRCILWWDRIIHEGIKPYFLSFTMLYEKVISYNNYRKANRNFDDTLFKNVLCSVIVQRNIMKFKPLKEDFVVGLFSISNAMNPRNEIISLIRTCCEKNKCMFTLPNKLMENFSYKRKTDWFAGGKFHTYMDGWGELLDRTFYPSDFWKYDNVQVFTINDVITNAKFTVIDGKVHTKKLFSQVNGQSHMMWYYFFVGNLVVDDIQTFDNSQTSYMRSFAQIYRMALGASGDQVYQFRTQAIRNRDPDLLYFINTKGCGSDGEHIFGTSGHIINMILMSLIMPIDLPRLIATFVGNWKAYLKDKKFLKRYKLCFNNGEIAESDSSITNLWHHPIDLTDVAATVEIFMKDLPLPGIDLGYIKLFLDDTRKKYEHRINLEKLPNVFSLTTLAGDD